MFKTTESSSSTKVTFFIRKKKKRYNGSWESRVAAEGITREVENQLGRGFVPEF